MRAHLPFGMPNYHMTVQMTRAETRNLLTAIGESTDHRLQEFYDVVKAELDKVEAIEEKQIFEVRKIFTYTVQAENKEEAEDLVRSGTGEQNPLIEYEVSK